MTVKRRMTNSLDCRHNRDNTCERSQYKTNLTYICGGIWIFASYNNGRRGIPRTFHAYMGPKSRVQQAGNNHRKGRLAPTATVLPLPRPSPNPYDLPSPAALNIFISPPSVSFYVHPFILPLLDPIHICTISSHPCSQHAQHLPFRPEPPSLHPCYCSHYFLSSAS